MGSRSSDAPSGHSCCCDGDDLIPGPETPAFAEERFLSNKKAIRLCSVDSNALTIIDLLYANFSGLSFIIRSRVAISLAEACSSSSRLLDLLDELGEADGMVKLSLFVLFFSSDPMFVTWPFLSGDVGEETATPEPRKPIIVLNLTLIIAMIFSWLLRYLKWLILNFSSSMSSDRDDVRAHLPYSVLCLRFNGKASVSFDLKKNLSVACSSGLMRSVLSGFCRLRGSLLVPMLWLPRAIKLSVNSFRSFLLNFENPRFVDSGTDDGGKGWE